jgi:hypothetical protein
MLYDYRLKDSVQDVVLECFCPLLKDIVEEYHRLRVEEWLSIYVPSYMGKELVGMLLEDDLDIWVDEDTEMYLLDDDTDVLITIREDGNLFVEEARGLNGKFKKANPSPLVYFYDGYPHKSLRDFDEDTNILCFGFVDEFEDEYDEEGILDLITDENDDVVGFRAYRETDEGFVGYECIRNYSMDEDDIYKTLRKVGLI